MRLVRNVAFVALVFLVWQGPAHPAAFGECGAGSGAYFDGFNDESWPYGNCSEMDSLVSDCQSYCSGPGVWCDGMKNVGCSAGCSWCQCGGCWPLL
jgi:hypothetical protein